ncbi:hypothetical protein CAUPRSCDRAFT_13013 [Caulochytrium protostelioides]|uniref:Uncharacterized protein n=1 Tax=Caulochytrium protostelioides TaxID=1555241 RepID=A0A4P9WQG2_9FUNG|nr:hypothetical protein CAUPRSCDRAFT_13013 [Caulochytrium protostelioides]
MAVAATGRLTGAAAAGRGRRRGRTRERAAARGAEAGADPGGRGGCGGGGASLREGGLGRVLVSGRDVDGLDKRPRRHGDIGLRELLDIAVELRSERPLGKRERVIAAKVGLGGGGGGEPVQCGGRPEKGRDILDVDGGAAAARHVDGGRSEARQRRHATVSDEGH